MFEFGGAVAGEWAVCLAVWQLSACAESLDLGMFECFLFLLSFFCCFQLCWVGKNLRGRSASSIDRSIEYFFFLHFLSSVFVFVFPSCCCLIWCEILLWSCCFDSFSESTAACIRRISPHGCSASLWFTGCCHDDFPLSLGM